MSGVLVHLIIVAIVAGLFAAALYAIGRSRRVESFMFMLAATLLLIVVWP